MLQPDDLAGRFDPHLPAWGPYTKGYIGFSHCADMELGLRFDLSVFPGLYRRATRLPNVRTESGYHPWEVAADLSYCKHRHEVLWKDRLYCDIAFSKVSDSARLITIDAVNNGDAPENLVLHYMANLAYPSSLPIGVVETSEGVTVVRGLSYGSMVSDEENLRRHLQWDGHRRGEGRCEGALGGFALGFNPGQTATVTWQTPASGALNIRYRAEQPAKISDAQGNTLAQLPAAEDWALAALGTFDDTVTLTIECAGVFYVDALVIGDASQANFITENPATTPQLEPIGDNALLVSYDDVPHCYGLLWPEEIASEVRTFATDTLDELFRETIHNHVQHAFKQGDPINTYTNVFLRPLCLAGNSAQTFYGLVCEGTRDEVIAQLGSFAEKKDDYIAQAESCRAACYAPDTLPGGEAYLPSQQRMAATTLSNVAFPIRTRGQYIRHYTPGRWWDCLYTWDSGCIGIGQLALDTDRAIENINAYVTEPEDDEAAFIHHGSPVPTQFLVFHGLWTRTQNRELLTYFYPRLKRYHDFLMGRIGGSSTRTLGSGLLRTWDYFYNSGGWDDYPPQQYVHKNGLQASVTPVINSAFAIRTAKILLQAARALGEDEQELLDDIQTLTDALQTHAWDEQAGYFSYLCHDDNGAPAEPLRHESGENFNAGLDGTSPLIADICTPPQQETLISKLMDPTHLWCKAGLSTVDQSAAYYRPDGYWNGAVWIPHQWFLWKAMLDHGRLGEAWRIAKTALDLWAHEVGESYNCFEHFLVETGRGAGWHHFSGLSAPVLDWFASYCTPGVLTTGFNAWVERADFAPGNTGLEAEVTFLPSANAPALIVTLDPSNTYRVRVDGAELSHTSPAPGRVELLLPEACERVVLQIVAD